MDPLIKKAVGHLVPQARRQPRTRTLDQLVLRKLIEAGAEIAEAEVHRWLDQWQASLLRRQQQRRPPIRRK